MRTVKAQLYSILILSWFHEHQWCPNTFKKLTKPTILKSSISLIFNFLRGTTLSRCCNAENRASFCLSIYRFPDNKFCVLCELYPFLAYVLLTMKYIKYSSSFTMLPWRSYASWKWEKSAKLINFRFIFVLLDIFGYS